MSYFPKGRKGTIFDGGKLVKGRKRFYITDTLGNLLDCFVVSANSYDGTTAASHWGNMHNSNELLQKIEAVFADGTFGDTFRKEMEERYNRRCSKDYERKTDNANAFIILVNIRRLCRKI